MQRMGSWGKKKSHRQFWSQNQQKQQREREREREWARVWDSVLRNGEHSLLSMTASEESCSPPTSLSCWPCRVEESICACLSLCYRGGGMLSSLHLSGGQESRVLSVAQFYPSGHRVQRYGPICVCVSFDAYLTHLWACMLTPLLILNFIWTLPLTNIPFRPSEQRDSRRNARRNLCWKLYA